MTLIVLDAAVAATAIGGGLALAAGLEDQRFPRSMLHRTPFPDYRIPGVLLAGGVGGCAAAALAEQLSPARQGGGWSVVAGVVLGGWLLGEIALLDQPQAPTPVEVAYLAAGGAMAGLGALQSRRPPAARPAARVRP